MCRLSMQGAVECTGNLLQSQQVTPPPAMLSAIKGQGKAKKMMCQSRLKESGNQDRVSRKIGLNRIGKGSIWMKFEVI